MRLGTKLHGSGRSVVSSPTGDVTSIFDHSKVSASAIKTSSNRGRGLRPLDLEAPERHDLVKEAKRIFDQRRNRSRYFPRSFFGEPAWDLLLILYFEAGQRPLTATGAAQVTDTPETTALRWVETLECTGFIESDTHPSDRRLRLLSLTLHGRAMMDQYLTATLRN